MFLGGVIADTGEGVSKLFANYFKSVYPEENNSSHCENKVDETF